MQSFLLASLASPPLARRLAPGLPADDTKRLTEFEMQLHNSCSVPLGFAALSVPGEGRLASCVYAGCLH